MRTCGMCKNALEFAYAILHIMGGIQPECSMSIQVPIENMEKALRDAGLTSRALCDKAGINTSTWTRWKAGLNAPNMDTWSKVTAAFGEMVSHQSSPSSSPENAGGVQ